MQPTRSQLFVTTFLTAACLLAPVAHQPVFAAVLGDLNDSGGPTPVDIADLQLMINALLQQPLDAAIVARAAAVDGNTTVPPILAATDLQMLINLILNAVPPTAPTGFRVVPQSCTSLGLIWSAPLDTGGAPIRWYHLYRNGGWFAQTASSSYFDDSRTESTTTNYRVLPENLNGVQLTSTDTIAATTPACSTGPGPYKPNSAQRFGGTSSDTVVAVATDSTSKEIILAGTFAGTANFGGSSLSATGTDDIFLAKYSSSGQHRWSKSFGDRGTVTISGMAVDSTGSIYMIGNFLGIISNPVNLGGGPVLTNGMHISLRWPFMGAAVESYRLERKVDGGSFAPLLVTLDRTNTGYSDVNIALNHTYQYRIQTVIQGVPSGFTLSGIASTTLPGSVTTAPAPAPSPAPLYLTASLASGQQDTFIAKYNKDGQYQWAKLFGGFSGETGAGIAIDARNNDVVAVGSFSDSVDFGGGGGGLVSSGGTDGFVVKYSAAGTYLSSQRFGGTLHEAGKAVTIDGAGNIFVASSNEVVVGANNRIDAALTKYSPSGNLQWTKQFGAAGALTGATAVAVDSQGNPMLAAEFSQADFGGGLITSSGGVDIIVAKYNGSDGSPRWIKHFGTGDTDNIKALAVDRADNVLISGKFFSPAFYLGPDPLIKMAGPSATYVAKLDPNGAHLWSKRFGKNSLPTSGDAVAVNRDVNGNDENVLAGFFTGTITFEDETLTSAGNADVFLAVFGP